MPSAVAEESYINNPTPVSIDLIGSEWIEVTSAAGWSARINHPTVSHDGYLWVLGGNDINFRSNDVWRSPASSPLPTAAFTATPTTGTTPLTVQFTDQSSNTPTSWKWEYSTGGAWTQFSTSQHPSHTFTSVGTYSIRLTATNDDGSDTNTKTDYIIVKEEHTVIEWLPPVTNENFVLRDGTTPPLEVSVARWRWKYYRRNAGRYLS